MAFIRKKRVLPIYMVGGTWLVWSLAAPLYKPTHYIMAGLASAAVYYLGKIIFPDQGYELDDPEEEASEAQKTQAEPVSPEVQQLLQERDRAVSEMRRLNDSIQDPTLSQQIDRLEHTTQKIMDAVAKSPDKLPQIRRFLNYYLPTTLKLLRTYTSVDDNPGEKARQICQEIDRILDTVNQALLQLFYHCVLISLPEVGRGQLRVVRCRGHVRQHRKHRAVHVHPGDGLGLLQVPSLDDDGGGGGVVPDPLRGLSAACGKQGQKHHIEYKQSVFLHVSHSISICFPFPCCFAIWAVQSNPIRARGIPICLSK